jgi:hypothetical protein
MHGRVGHGILVGGSGWGRVDSKIYKPATPPSQEVDNICSSTSPSPPSLSNLLSLASLVVPVAVDSQSTHLGRSELQSTLATPWQCHTRSPRMSQPPSSRGG